MGDSKAPSIRAHYDAIVIGSGQGGGPLSTALVASGRTTALIERKHIGGTCINEGCTPTKTMYASGRVAYLARRGPEYGVEDRPVTVDMEAVRRRKRNIVEEFRAGSLQAIEDGGADVIMGEASFTSPKSVGIRLRDGGHREVSAEWFFIDTGSRPWHPPIPGLETVAALNSTTVMELDEVPEHLVIIGGGYIGVEFSQLFRRFGSRVTVVELGDRLLGREDMDVAEAVAGVLEQDGIDICLSTKTRSVMPAEGDGVVLCVEGPGGEHEIAGSHLLVAIGRKANTEKLNLGTAGVETTDRGFLKVNARLETTAAGIYGIGEVAGTPAFTHMSYDDFRILRTNLLERGNRSTDDRLVPYTVFIDPQLGRIGLTEQEARERGLTVKVARLPMTAVARALEMGESRGMIKAVVDDGTEEILGCAVLGIEGGELMAMVEIAMMGKLPYTALRDGIFAHPTLAESLNNLFSKL
jgi:pyruvate/2-oxoglutarate dehydrogenase complex dihydrolipoamide dehydrogenase (E3) component